MLNVTNSIAIPEDEFTWSYVRASGPGGQNVNKVASKAVLRWPVAESPSLPAPIKQRLIALQKRRVTSSGELLVTGQRFRDQERNRQDCLEKLAAMILEASHVPKTRRATRPTRGSHTRRLAAKKHRKAIKTGRRHEIDD